MKRILIALTAALLLPLAAHAQPGGPGGPGFGRGGPGNGMGFGLRMLDRAADVLDLDDATRKKIKELTYNAERASIPLRGRLQAAELDLRHALDQDKPDRADVMRKLEEVGKLKLQMQQYHVGLLLDVRALLTPEQVRQLQQMRGKQGKRGRGWGRRGRRGGGWGGPPGPPDPPPPPDDDDDDDD